MADIVIKMATRERPDKFKKTLQKHIDYLSGKHNVRFIITMDEDDDSMNTDDMREWLESRGVPVKYNYGQSKTKIEACNADLENETGDILVLTSDDMIPCLEGYDDIISQGFDQCYPDYVGAIKFNDGLRPKEDLLMTLPVMGFPLYEAIGYLYHPDYTSIYCDNEMTSVCAKMNKLAISPTCIIRHEWIHGNDPTADALHQRNESSEMYQKDGAVYNERMKIDFEVDKVKERLNASGYALT